MKNPDGSEYRVSGLRQNYNPDPNSTENALFNSWDAEAIKQGGIPIYYYEMLVDVNSINEIYREARNKLFSTTAIELWAVYEPKANQFLYEEFINSGIDETIFELNYQDVLNSIGHPPVVGSRIWTPHRQENWVILRNQLSGFELWKTTRIQIACQKFQESITTNEGKVTENNPSYDLNNFYIPEN